MARSVASLSGSVMDNASSFDAETDLADQGGYFWLPCQFMSIQTGSATIESSIILP
jgi:hypothetical protein